jgi:hypothetical protein
MEECLSNDDLIRKLCSQYDKALYTEYDDLNSPGKYMCISLYFYDIFEKFVVIKSYNHCYIFCEYRFTKHI